jgi:hypothetical protein
MNHYIDVIYKKIPHCCCVFFIFVISLLIKGLLKNMNIVNIDFDDKKNNGP